MKLFSYVVDHDAGYGPNPYFGLCTLCRCKFRKFPERPKNIVELAEKGDWVVGTGGANPQKSAGHGKLVYAMQVEQKLTWNIMRVLASNLKSLCRMAISAATWNNKPPQRIR